MIIGYLCIVISTVLLILSGLQGYFQFYLFKANHSQFALFTAIFYMFTETLIMFYFIGSGVAIKKKITTDFFPLQLYNKVKKTKMVLFPHITLNMIVIGTVFILGGAVQTRNLSGWIHGVLFDIAFLHFLYTSKLEHQGFKANINVLIELADLSKLKRK